jgi:hypothetical protein
MELDKFECNLEDLSENLKKINFRVSNKVFWEIFRDIDQK